jgi:prolyl 4-hydroxylase
MWLIILTVIAVIFLYIRSGKRQSEKRTVLSSNPVITQYDEFLSPEEAIHIIDTYQSRLERSTVLSSGGQSKIDNVRTSYTYYLPSGKNDSVIAGIEERAANVMGVPVDWLETLQMIRYTEGQEYKPHFDWFTTKGDNRSHTIIVYLNDVENGGETWFEFNDLKVKPKLGRAVHFKNCDSTECDSKTKHAGLPPVQSIKYALNIWGRTAKWR